MELTNLNKNISEILRNQYVVPLYQRNYAWSVEEIHQLIQDIHKQYIKDASSYYYIGSLVVVKRDNGNYEVIDGQQRLTTISLVAKQLKNTITNSSLRYDSRPEVESFLSYYFQNGKVPQTTSNHLTSHFKEAVDYIKNAELDVESESKITLTQLGESDLKKFQTYFFNQVQIVQVEIPGDTDVAHYFEIMNNRGEQLEQHEIIKAKLLDKIKKDEEESMLFSRIWDACSQMNTQVQRSFSKEERENFFGENYEGFTLGFDPEEVKSNTGFHHEKNRLNIEDIIVSGKKLN